MCRHFSSKEIWQLDRQDNSWAAPCLGAGPSVSLARPGHDISVEAALAKQMSREQLKGEA
jgi:hypothetical protein